MVMGIGLGEILLGICAIAALILTYFIIKHSKNYTKKTTINQLEKNPELQEEVRQRFGWK